MLESCLPSFSDPFEYVTVWHLTGSPGRHHKGSASWSQSVFQLPAMAQESLSRLYFLLKRFLGPGVKVLDHLSLPSSLPSNQPCLAQPAELGAFPVLFKLTP